MATFTECYYLFFWFASMVIAAHTMVSKNVSDGSFYTMCVVIGGCYVLPILSLINENCRRPDCTPKPKPKNVNVIVPKESNGVV